VASSEAGEVAGVVNEDVTMCGTVRSMDEQCAQVTQKIAFYRSSPAPERKYWRSTAGELGRSCLGHALSHFKAAFTLPRNTTTQSSTGSKQLSTMVGKNCL
jgi:hypothetical protein